MKKFYVASFNEDSGISKYSKVFYQRILHDKGFIHLEPSLGRVELMTRMASRDHIHLEIGIFQRQSVDLLMAMVAAEYQHLSITLHDPPLLRYPFKTWPMPLMNQVAKFVDRFVFDFGHNVRVLEKLRTVFVLSKHAASLMRIQYGLKNICYLPHLVSEAPILKPIESDGRHLMYFGFIGANKGVEYALQVHRSLLKKDPSLKMYVVGKAMGRQVEYLKTLQSQYHQNVVYTGYLPDEALKELMKEVAIVLLPFRDYKFFWPMSGTVLQAMSNRKIVFASRVNAIPEVITEGLNGFNLYGVLTRDVTAVASVLNDKALRQQIEGNLPDYLENFHGTEIVRKNFDAASRALTHDEAHLKNILTAANTNEF
jgi:glycosyltransferase involved in cell wall biosynthesis